MSQKYYIQQTECLHSLLLSYTECFSVLEYITSDMGMLFSLLSLSKLSFPAIGKCPICLFLALFFYIFFILKALHL